MSLAGVPRYFENRECNFQDERYSGNSTKTAKIKQGSGLLNDKCMLPGFFVCLFVCLFLFCFVLFCFVQKN